MSDPVSDFIGAMEASGIRPVEPIAARLASGSLIRFRCEGDGPKRQNGWAIMFLDDGARPGGAFGNYRLNTGTITWKSGDRVSLSRSERAALHREWEAARAKKERAQKEQHEEAARIVRAEWYAATAAFPSHRYLKRKGLGPEGIRQSGDRLLVPMFDAGLRLWNVQTIGPNGRKLFTPKCRTSGLFWLHGVTLKPDNSASASPIVIGEGFSTMAAIHQATGYGVFAAMSAHNLGAVAREVRNTFPGRLIVIAADDDRHLKSNTGLEAAQMAAQAIGAHLATPEPLRPETRSGESGIDFADIPRADVAARIEQALKGNGND